jgi:hypothetical protein
MFLSISNVACSIESLFLAICYLLINNHPVSRRPYVLALATSIVRDDFGLATQPCLCPSMWITCAAANDLYFYLASRWISCVPRDAMNAFTGRPRFHRLYCVSTVA